MEVGRKKGDSHFPLHLAWGRATGFNQPRACVFVHVLSVSENLPAARMETQLVMHLPLLVAGDSLGHPYIARVCRLLPIVHPSHSARPPPSSALSLPPSSTLPLRQWLQLQKDTVKAYFNSYTLNNVIRNERGVGSSKCNSQVKNSQPPARWTLKFY